MRRRGKHAKPDRKDDKVQGATDFVYEEARGHGAMPYRKYGTGRGAKGKTR